MRRITRRDFIILTAGTAAAAVAVACGEDDDSGSPTAGATSSASTPTVATGSDNGAASLRWFGQAMFLLTSPGGTTVLLDPFNDIGYTVPPPLDANVATITHEHPDHNNDALGGATATVLRGLTADGWAEIDETTGDVHIRTVQTYHDEAQGAERGRNAAFVIEAGGLRFAHLGDLGHTLDETQRAAIGEVDVLMLPVGGVFTLDAAGASTVTNQLAPMMVFPMHYQTPTGGAVLATADEFLAGKSVERVGATNIRIARGEMPESLTAYVLDYE